MMNASEYVGCALAGVYPDCRALLDYAVGEALKYLKEYRTPMPVKKLANQVTVEFYCRSATVNIVFFFGSLFDWRNFPIIV